MKLSKYECITVPSCMDESHEYVRQNSPKIKIKQTKGFSIKNTMDKKIYKFLI